MTAPVSGSPRALAPAKRSLAFKIFESVANGGTLRAICAGEGMPCERTVRVWIMRDDELRQAYAEAKSLKADAIFDESLDAAREIKNKAGLASSPEVRAYEVAINHFRWTAGKLKPQEYGEHSLKAPVIPVQIITSLNLGAGGADGAPPNPDAIYTIDLTATASPDATQEPQEPAAGGRGGSSSAAVGRRRPKLGARSDEGEANRSD